VDVEPLRLRLREALVTAMKARDPVARGAIRSALGAIDNAEAVAPPDAAPAGDDVIAKALTGLGAGEAARLDLSESRIADIVRAEVADRRAAAADYGQAGRAERAARLNAEADVLAAHLDAT
jgi:uncharacterized protein YqeY